MAAIRVRLGCPDLLGCVVQEMIPIYNRLDPAQSDISRSLRKYSLALIRHAIELANKIGTTRASEATGIPIRRLARLRLADKRSRMTLDQALAEIGTAKPMAMPRGRGFCDPDKIARLNAKLRADLLVRVEAAREGYRMAERTSSNVMACIRAAADRRGLNGESVCKLVREGRIPSQWIK